jgi:NAD(P)-dependent dehydrogenase (short-subunit alcohol dehydrogenase family)
MTLDGKVALVTGAGNGVGRGVAAALARAGAHVVVSSPGDNGRETVALIVGRGGSAAWSRCDVTDGDEVRSVVDRAAAVHGRLDVVVHNATSRHSSEWHRLEEVAPELFDDHVAVSLRGAYHCAVAGWPHLRGRGGRFVLFTSPAGMEGSVTKPLYGVVKSAIRGLTKSLAREWGPDGINVNCISPLAMTPAMVTAYAADPELQRRHERMVPLGYLGDPEEDIGPAVVFLAGPGARYVTGQTLVVDGGRFTVL